MVCNRRRRRFLCGEQLESRAMLAGNVTASVSGGVLVIRGDGDDNGISISQVDADSYAVVGFTAGGGDTTLNGELEAQQFDGVTNGFNIDLRGGDDVLVIGNDLEASATLAADLTGEAVTIDLGAEIIVDASVDPVQTAISGNVLIRTNSGDDIVSVNAAVGTESAVRNLNIATSGGDDQVFVTGTDVSGSLIVNTGDGDDLLEITDSAISGHLNVVMGLGNDSLTVNTAVEEEPLSNSARSAVFNTGAGNDTVSIFDFSTEFDTVVVTNAGDDSISIESADARNLIVNAGPGNNTVAITDVLLDDNLVVTAGTGNDGISVSLVEADNVIVNAGSGTNSVTAGDLLLDGNLVVHAGGGDDAIEATAVTADSLIVSAGGGNDGVVLGGLDLGVDLVVNLGSGDDSLELAEADIDDDLVILGLSGVDTISVAGVNVGDDATIDAGTGNDEVTLDTVAVVDRLFGFMGSGDDTLSIGGSSAASALLRGGVGLDTYNDGGNTFDDEDIAQFEA